MSEFGSPGQETTPPVYEPPSYDPPLEIIDLSTYDIPRLGCGIYSVIVTEIGGGTQEGSDTICEETDLRLIGIKFERRINEISEASITVALKGNDPDCCACLSGVRPWRHELSISRDGDLVWTGPITGMTVDLNTSSMEIRARDLMAWFDKRVYEDSADYDVEDIDLSQIFTDLFDHGYTKEPFFFTNNITQVAIPTSRFYPGYDTDTWGGRYPIIGDELRSLVEAGIDYTVVNRNLFAGDIETSFDTWYGLPHTVPILIDQHWAELPQIEVVGTYMSNYTIVGGGYTGYYGWSEDAMWIVDTSTGSPDGLLETVHIRNDMEDVFTDEHPNAITAEAFARNEFNKNPYLILSGGQLAADAPFDFDVLIPGLQVGLSISSSCLTLDPFYRIHRISVELTANSESVNIELAPVGSEGFQG